MSGFALAVAWLLLELIPLPVVALFLSSVGALYFLRRTPLTLRISALVLLIGACGVWLHWFTWSVPASCILVLVGFRILGIWLGRPLRHRHCKFEDFTEFLGPWPESLDRGASIFIEPEGPRKSRLRFRVVSRGETKRLKVKLPRRKNTEAALQAEIEALTGPFQDILLREHPRSLELTLPAQAPYTGSVASRAAKAALLAIGCTDESTFTIYCEGAHDPYYELRVSEQIAESTSGIIKRVFEARAKQIRASIPRKKEAKKPAA